jgi:two-component system phosphate regulon sensor histidine kinase PhoR
VIGAMIALRAGWKAFRQQELLSEMKTNFLSSVSHELRTPIASIRLMAEGLQRGTISEPAKQAEYYRLILQESRRVSGLVENVLDVSRIERGRKQYSVEPCDMNKLFHATLDGLRPYAEDKKVHLESRVQGTPGPVDCDSIAIQQVLVNLIDNAIKHSPAGATVLVLLEFEDQSVRLSVSDVGPGIPAEDHEKIFEPFFRRGSELRRETQGTGLGLSIVRHAIEAHGGSIKVESEPGQGSRFVLMLPTVGAKSHAAEVKS